MHAMQLCTAVCMNTVIRFMPFCKVKSLFSAKSLSLRRKTLLFPPIRNFLHKYLHIFAEYSLIVLENGFIFFRKKMSIRKGENYVRNH